MPSGVSNALDIFEGLKALVGKWHGTNEEGRPVSIVYEMTANDTALVEDWFFDNGMRALTIYHMDHDTLMAMHYCPIGNQPRLDLIRQDADGLLAFECVSATHLKSKTDPHEHAFDLRINPDGSLYRSETYYEDDGRLESNAAVFRREA